MKTGIRYIYVIRYRWYLFDGGRALLVRAPQMGALSADEQAVFARQGWLLKPSVFSEPELAPLQDAISLQLDALVAQLIKDGRLAAADAFEGEPFATRLGRVVHALPDEDSKMEVIGVMSALMLPGYDMTIYPSDPTPLADAMIGCLRHALLLDAVASLLGTDDIVGQSTFRIRPKLPLDPVVRDAMAFDPGAVAMHQDSGYMLPHCESELIVTCWIPFACPATVANGCLQVLPRKHSEGIMRHWLPPAGSGYIQLLPDDLDGSTAGAAPHPVEMAVGDVLFLTNHTPHASGENLSDVTRWSMDLRYGAFSMPNSAEVLVPSGASEASMVDEGSSSVAHGVACSPPERDFIVRDTQHPEREIVDGQGLMAARSRLNLGRELLEISRSSHEQRGWGPVAEAPKL